jgi:hypothetical protein
VEHVVCPFVLFLLAIVLPVFLRYTDSDYLFDIFKLFLPTAIPNSANDKWNISVVICDTDIP